MTTNLLLKRIVLVAIAAFAGLFQIEAQEITLGTGTATNCSTCYPAPYGNYYYGAKTQMLILASEISGNCGPINQINQLTMPVSTTNGGAALTNLTIKLGHTSSTALSTTWETGLSTVYSVGSYQPVNGDNVHVFDSCFAWNGTDNIVVEVCFNNNAYAQHSSHYYTSTSFTSTHWYRADNTTVCSSTANSGTSTNRPNMRLGYSTTYSVDASLQNLSSPSSGCSFSSAETITVDIYNNGANTITSLPLAYKINGGSAVTGTFTGSLAPCSSTTYSFPTTANLSSGSSFDVQVYVNTTNDSCNLNDTVSETVGSQLSGSYTVGGSSPDYASISAAVTDLNNIGICGPVTLLLRDAATFNETVTIGTVTGASNTNTITFTSDPSNSSMATISGSGYAVYANGMSYCIFDSLNLYSSGSYVVYMVGTNTDNVFRNCEIGTVSNYYGIYEGSALVDGLEVDNCDVLAYGYSFYLYGSFSAHHNNLTFTDNNLENFLYRALYLYYADSINVHGNTMTGGTTTGTQYGIYFGGNGLDIDITYNTMLIPTTGTGYAIYGFQGGISTHHAVCANNMIMIPNSSSTSRGIYVSSYGYWDILNNSVRTKATSTSTTYASIYASGATNTIQNNAVRKDGSGYAMYISTSATHDYNVYYTESGTAYNVTAGSNEYNSAPGFISNTDLHISGYTDTYNNGTPIGTITVDIDGESRSSTPDIGADEYDLPEYDFGVIALTTPSAPITAGSQSVSVTIQNLGILAVDTVSVDWDFNGSAQTGATLTGSWAAGDIDSNATLGTVNIPSGFSTIKAWTHDPDNETDEDQSNDTMTFDICTGLSGTYTLGTGSGFDFNSFAEATDALENCGLAGAVTIEVDSASGPFVEQVSLNGPINGSSSTNTITFNGNNAILQDAPTSAPYAIFLLAGAEYVTIDSLQIISTSSTAGYGVQFMNQADYNTISNCYIEVANYPSTNCMGIVFSGSNANYYTTEPGGNGHYNIIENNEIFGGYYSVSIYGTSTTSYRNTYNEFDGNMLDGFYSTGFYCYYNVGTSITNNEITRENSGSFTTFYGIYANRSDDDMIISGNWIHSPGNGSYTSYGIRLYYGYLGVGESVCENNIVSDMGGTSTTLYGIQSYQSDNWKVRHNTIDIQTSSSGTTYGFHHYASSTTYISDGFDFMNNIVNVEGASGSKYNMYFQNSTYTPDCDYNVLYNDSASSSSYIGYRGATYAELTDWLATGNDSNSIQSSPIFTSSSGGNLTPLSIAIDDLGTPLGVNEDFYGNTRSSSTPDIGAIEFDGVPGDMSLESGSLTRVSVCYGSSDTVSATILNYVGPTANFANDSLHVYWSVTGPETSNGVISINSGTLANGSTVTVSAAGVDMSSPGTYTLSLYIDTNDVNGATGNDTLTETFVTEVDPILSASPSYQFVTSPYDSVLLVAATPMIAAQSALFSEISHWQYSGHTPVGGWPSWLNSDDYVEIMGPAGTSLEGLTIEQYYSNATTPVQSFTFGPGSKFDANGIAVLGWGGTAGAVDITNNYYTAGLNGALMGYTTPAGYIIRNSSNDIIDVAVHRYTGAYTWNAATGVTSGDWSGTYTGLPASGIRRVAATDNNVHTDFLHAYANTNYQNPGQPNDGPNPILGAATPQIEWTESSSFVSNNQSFFVGPWSADDSLTYIVEFDSTCGTYYDTVIIVIDIMEIELIDSVDVTCASDADGSAEVLAEGGGTPYTYAWSDGQTTAEATGLSGGVYTVTVTDAHGYSLMASVDIHEPDSLLATMSSTESTCGVANGSATATTTGGTTAYAYSWSSGATTATATALNSGLYTVTITDANGCTHENSIVVADAGSPSIAFSTTDVVCGGDSTGAITSIVTGGTGPYSYEWSTSDTSTSITGLEIGTYTLTVTDAAACAVFNDTTITGNDTLEVSGAITNLSCFNAGDGAITATATGGVAGYTFAWSNSATTATTTSLAAGAYFVTATDAVGCTVESDSLHVTEPDLLVATIDTVSNVSCKDLSDGSATVMGTGGTTAYSYLWSNSASTATASGLVDGSYSVTITDANGCVATTDTVITEPDSLLTMITAITDVACFGDSTGAMTTATTGGTTPYTYAWSNGATSANLSGAAAGFHSYTVTDDNGCTDSDSDTINSAPEVISIDSIIIPLCNGDSNASIYLTTSGGTGSLSWAWSNSETTEDITGIPSDTFTVTITDGSGCDFDFTYVVTEPDPVSWSIDTVVNSLCENGNQGEIYITPAGGTAPYTYLWSDSTTAEDNLAAYVGTYFMTITDTNGCAFTDSADVGFIQAAPFIEITGDDSVCYGTLSQLTATSGFGDYLWNDSSIFSVLYVGESGVYSVTATDFDGCTNWDSIEVFVGDSMELDVTGDNVNCEGGNDGSVATLTTGGFTPYSYTWSDAQTTATATGLVVGTYSVTVSDAIGCTLTGDATLDFDNTNPIIDLGNDTIVCYNSDFGTFGGVVLDPGAGFSVYNWSTSETSPTITTTNPGVYSVVVEDANGCFGTDSITIDSMICLGVGELTSNIGISIYPNPTLNDATLTLDVNELGDYQMMLLDVKGQLVRAQELNVNTRTFMTQIERKGLDAGVYTLRITNGSSVQNARVIFH